MNQVAPESTKDRIARMRRRQVNALSDAGQTPARREQPERAHDAGTVVGLDAHDGQDASTPHRAEQANLLKEFEALLPAALKIYAYLPEDIALIRAAVSGPTPLALRELKEMVKVWRIEAVANGLDLPDALTDKSALMTEGVATRARIQFSMTIMGKSTDESGYPLTEDLLDWKPEPSYWAVFGLGVAPSLPAPAGLEPKPPATAQSAKRPKP
jgi:hypothetical protein